MLYENFHQFQIIMDVAFYGMEKSKNVQLKLVDVWHVIWTYFFPGLQES